MSNETVNVLCVPLDELDAFWLGALAAGRMTCVIDGDLGFAFLGAVE